MARGQVILMKTAVTFLRLTALLGGVTIAPWAQTLAPMRPPAVPLVVHDPYFSIWSAADHLTDTATTHWTGKPNGLSLAVRVDGKVYSLTGGTGRGGRGAPGANALPQTRLAVLPTRTIYEFAGAGVGVTLTFLTPALPDDLDVLSRPLTYIEWAVRSTDGQEHQAAVSLQAASDLVVNTADEPVWAARLSLDGQPVLRMGSREQPVLAKRGDDLRIDWGFLYLAADKAEGVSQAIATRQQATAAFANPGKMPDSDDFSEGPRGGRPPTPVLAFAIDLGKVAAQPVSRYLMMAYDDLYSIEFFERRERAWWRRNGADAADLLRMGRRDHDALAAKSKAFRRSTDGRPSPHRWRTLCAPGRAGLSADARRAQAVGRCRRHGDVLSWGELQQRLHLHGGCDLSQFAVYAAVQSEVTARAA